MIIAILGSGGREHALCDKISKSPKVKKIFCIPGNAGTSKIATNIDINLDNFDELKDFLQKSKVDLVIVGPEKPLVNGVVDYLDSHNIKTFGPKKKSSQLEGSKIFTKQICEKYNIPTAKFGIFKNINETNEFLKKTEMPIVIKADGLASGKGVYICETLDEAQNATKDIFGGKFGLAKNILIEEVLSGDEMSYFIISDGKTFKNFNTAQDHKRIFDGDKGKNTGGMGAYSPSGLINQHLRDKIINKIIKPTLKALGDMGENYTGFLYAGLMIKNNEPYLIEYNVRMGDPECQTILPLLNSDLLSLIQACCEQKLENQKLDWLSQKSLCIVLSSKGYPDKFESNIEIKNLDTLETNLKNYVFHASTKNINKIVYSNGGRVLNFVSVSNEYKDSRRKALEMINKLNWPNGYYRKDIGYKIIDQ